jgi:hypothetical protein
MVGLLCVNARLSGVANAFTLLARRGCTRMIFTQQTALRLARFTGRRGRIATEQRAAQMAGRRAVL